MVDVVVFECFFVECLLVFWFCDCGDVFGVVCFECLVGK